MDQVDFENMAYVQLIELVFTEFVHQQMKELESCDEDTTDGGLFSICEDYLATSDDAKRWSKYAGKLYQ